MTQKLKHMHCNASYLFSNGYLKKIKMVIIFNDWKKIAIPNTFMKLTNNFIGYEINVVH